MTDKELAEEYVLHNCDDSLNSFRGLELKQAFLAGLNAKTQWHKANEIQYYEDIPNNKDTRPKTATNIKRM